MIDVDLIDLGKVSEETLSRKQIFFEPDSQEPLLPVE